MSLANDILKRAGLNLSPPPPRQTPRKPAFMKKVPRKPKESKRVKIAPKKERPETPVGVSWTCKSWGLTDGSVTTKEYFRAYCREDGVTVMLGEFPTAARAHVAYRLYRLWKRRGFTDAPAKPSKRLYTRRQIAD